MSNSLFFCSQKQTARVHDGKDGVFRGIDLAEVEFLAQQSNEFVAPDVVGWPHHLRHRLQRLVHLAVELDAPGTRCGPEGKRKKEKKKRKKTTKNSFMSKKKGTFLGGGGGK
jgi:hypothetical protein